ncbi:pyridoxal kinase [Bradysia coprophila]|uniref:pyridoxal kinase n=1 Tax=Bradysia coprophila TaxID=38358 RepID=UPI00187D8281|nr:pyridoxal kinase [Bradysia coprophila]
MSLLNSLYRRVGNNFPTNCSSLIKSVRYIGKNHKIMSDKSYRVLSIQSHVVHGYVGNKSATFPLQVLGFEVDAINSVQFSNHTGYKFIKGQVLDEKQLDDVFAGLVQNNLLDNYTHLLTGYIGNDQFLRKIADIVRKLREVNPNIVYVCDPVMGDNGEMYVPKTLLPIYRDEIIPLADICTPNQYEMELLTGHENIKTKEDTLKSLNWFHERGVNTVALSSTSLGTPDQLLAFLSHQTKDKQRQLFSLSIPKQGNGINFTGTGDLFASLFLAHSSLSANLQVAFENTIASLQAVISNTIAAMPSDLVRAGKIESRHRELKLVQSKNDIERPQVTLVAKPEH